ncbi:PEP-CTERM sorting domain-containing protein [Rhizophagus clarus]|uniref:PEP-CTERM sorting domain-containing protein n=1 Tax=Rhizophagus clarus TaxID=94130 RepID=A0A8H3L6N4_9GLOM|nr:PEP-CTERM sorting domain-containing protein [Rhizophagus clarus]
MTKWSLSSNFSLTYNPSSVWSYGSKPAGYHVTGTFSLFTHLDLEPNEHEIAAWFGGGTIWYTHWLGLYYNTKPTAVNLGTIELIANGVAMHPGDDGRFSVARFTAPRDGNYVLDVTFTHIHDCAQHSGGYIIYNSVTAIWEVDLTGPGDSRLFKTTDSGITVRANEHIDFIVGVGIDNKYDCDMTLARVDIHLLDLLENQPGIIAGSIGFGFVLGYQLSVNL